MAFKDKQQMTVLPLATIQGAFAKFSGNEPLGQEAKSTMITWLDAHIDRGHFSLADVVGSLPFAPHVTNVGNSSAVESVANKAQSLALESVEKITALQGALAGHEKTLAVIQQSIESLAEVNVGVDQAEVDRKLNVLLDKAFKPFKQAVKDAGAESIVVNMSNVHKIARKSCKDVFGLDLPLEFDVYNDPTSPPVDPNFIWTESILRTLAFAQDTGRNTWFGGEKGTGKSQTAQEFASRTGRGFMRYNFHKYTTASDYLGDVGLENNATVFKQGDFLRAYTAPSTVILLDEITNADQGELAPLNGFLEPNAKVTYGGSTWTRALGVMVFGADNTLLNGDTSGRYAGTRTTNTALADRFTAVIKFTHLPFALEVKAVMNHTGCKKELAEHVLKAIGVARSKVETGDILDAPSIRQVIGFVEMLPYHSVSDAWDLVMVNRQVEDSGIALKGIMSACLNESHIQSLI
jgi:MoxR-like ATPase